MATITLIQRTAVLGAVALGAVGLVPSTLYAAPFLPSDVSNLTVWLDASAGVTKDGSDKVSAWADQSSNGNNAAQATAGLQGTYIASDAAFNNMPVINFASGNVMQAPLPLTSASGFTVFVVAEHNAAAAGQTLVAAKSGATYSGTDQWFIMESTASSNYGVVNRNGSLQPSVTNGVLDNDLHIYSLTFDGNAGPSYTNNLTQTVDANSASTDAVFTNITFATLDIAAYIHNGNPNDYGNAKIAEILVYGKALSSEEQGSVQTYLTNKYTLVPEPTSLMLGLGCSAPLMLRKRRAV